jgi:hypothetical protein
MFFTRTLLVALVVLCSPINEARLRVVVGEGLSARSHVLDRKASHVNPTIDTPVIPIKKHHRYTVLTTLY